MDRIDDAILRELTADARLPFRELGARVGLSANATAARVRRLQEDGVIRGFTVVRGSSAGSSSAGLEVFVEVRLADGTTNEAFTTAVSTQFPQVTDAVHVTGAYDYLLHAVVPDAAALDLLVRRLKRDAGAAQTFTRLALRGS